jgi:uncharacterized protein
MILESFHAQIETLCRKHCVRKLELFGSAVRGEFRAGQSDYDFFVEFISYDSSAILDQWFGLQEDLRHLLGVKVDSASRRAATNPYFLERANRKTVVLYAA